MPTQVRIGWRSGSSSQTAASIVTSGLILNLDAGNTTSYSGTGTTWTDLSGNNLNATLVNGTTYRTSYGGHLQFDGINDAAVLAYNTKLDPATAYRDLPFSINGWVKFDGAGGGTFMNKGDNGNASYETYTVSILPTGLQIILYNNASIYVTIKTTGITLNPGTWYNFATAYTGGYGTPDYQPNYNGTMKLYINGAECATTVTITGSYIKMDPINTSTFIGSFGQVGAPGSYWATSFNGSVAQTLMYSRQLTSTEVLQNFNATKARFTLDTDAQAFVTAASITDATQQSAVNTLVTSLKSAGIWTKMRALYPFVGGTAASHKFNLKDPRDLDAAYRLVFNGGWVHSSTGAKPNGSNAYADTKLVPSTTLTQYNSHLSYYSRSQTLSSSNIEFGAYVNDNQCMFLTLQRSGGSDNGGAVQYSISADSNMALLFGNTTTTGMYLSNRTSSTATSLKYIRNGVSLANATTTAGSLPSIPLFLGGSNDNGSPLYYSAKESAFASIGDGLTDAEVLVFYNVVQTFQTTLGRHVGVPIVADTDAQAFLNAAIITDSTQASAVNTLVT